MSPEVRLRSGIEVEFDTGETFILDGTGDGEATVVSHAHGDHLVERDRIVTSELTADLVAARRDKSDLSIAESSTITLHNAGHIAGSRAAKLIDPTTGRRFLYTGDCCTRDRFYLNGFEPVNADLLIIETTYGIPKYTFPPVGEVVDEIHDWLADTMDDVVFLFGYALGRAQKLQRILADSPRNRVFTTDAVVTLNKVIEDHLDVSFDAQWYDSTVELEPGDALVLPTQTSRLSWIESLIEKHDAITAGFSGWAADQSFIYQRGYDKGFILSDHCDFQELVDVVKAVAPDRVYTHHGYAAEFATYLTKEYGFETRSLERNQSTLADF